jgi:hypothetical protein
VDGIDVPDLGLHDEKLLYPVLSCSRERVMKAISVVLRGAAVSAALLVLSTAAHADDFTDACMLGSDPATDMPKTCACMSTKITGAGRADAIEALRRSYKAMSDTSKSIDPSTLPPNVMRGLQAVVLAQADCM